MFRTSHMPLPLGIGITKDIVSNRIFPHVLKDYRVGKNAVSTDNALPLLVLGDGGENRPTHIGLPKSSVTLVVTHLPPSEYSIEVDIVLVTHVTNVVDSRNVYTIQGGRNHLRKL